MEIRGTKCPTEEVIAALLKKSGVKLESKAYSILNEFIVKYTLEILSESKKYSDLSDSKTLTEEDVEFSPFLKPSLALKEKEFPELYHFDTLDESCKAKNKTKFMTFPDSSFFEDNFSQHAIASS